MSPTSGILACSREDHVSHGNLQMFSCLIIIFRDAQPRQVLDLLHGGRAAHTAREHHKRVKLVRFSTSDLAILHTVLTCVCTSGCCCSHIRYALSATYILLLTPIALPADTNIFKCRVAMRLERFVCIRWRLVYNLRCSPLLQQVAAKEDDGEELGKRYLKQNHLISTP
jgi:hypothetical protein